LAKKKKNRLAPGCRCRSAPGAGQQASSGNSTPPAAAVEIGVAYGTEKQRWLQWAAGEFASTPAGQHIKVNLIPKGSLEGAQAILAGNEKIHVWSPASALYEDVFASEWQLRHNKAPFVRKEALALSPMVFVLWAERYDAFIAKYKEVTFRTIGQALKEPGGWDAIAKKPEWGLFKFGHTHPNSIEQRADDAGAHGARFSQQEPRPRSEDILNRISGMDERHRRRDRPACLTHGQHDARHGAARAIELRRALCL
jgi:hypothetical protein